MTTDVSGHSNLADFLGDPKFPSKAMKSPRGLRIVYFQELYRLYSRLNLSFVEDRPYAIEGLENRLRAAYGTSGGFGIFDDGPGHGLFHRSLLWRRGNDEPQPGLVAIRFPTRRRGNGTAAADAQEVPTWSWMAYRGGIDYLDPEFKETEWERRDIRPPWTGGGVGSAPGDPVELFTTVRDYDPAAARSAGDSKLVFDGDRQASDASLSQCVVVAHAKEPREVGNRRYYVLLVAMTGSTADGDKVYKRVGAGYMLGKYIALEKPGTSARIR